MGVSLKFYFRLPENGPPCLESIPVLEGVEPKLPTDFLKWKEDGDLGKPIYDSDDIDLSETPVLNIVFSPWTMGPSLEAAVFKARLKRKEGETDGDSVAASTSVLG